MTKDNIEDASANIGLTGEASRRLDVLHDSAAQLASIVEPLSSEQLRQRAYPAKWTVSDVLSHVGSGAVITRLNVDAALAGDAVGPDVMQGIWDEWNSKSPEEQAAGALAADRDLLTRLDLLTGEDQAGFHLALGPLELDLAAYIGTRVNEHALHTWDIDVSLDPAATLLADAVEVVVDNLGLIARFGSKPTGADRTITVHTSSPSRDFEVVLRPDEIVLSPSTPVAQPNLELAAEAFVRLVYGRLDRDHTPSFGGAEADLDELRRAFPGV